MKFNYKYLPLLGFIFGNTIISLMVICFYACLFVVWLFKNAPKDF